MESPADEEYVVIGKRQKNPEEYPNSKLTLWFWTGKGFSGNPEKALIHERYGRTVDSIWNGPLWEQSDKLKNLDFFRLIAFPKRLIETEINPELLGVGYIPFVEIDNEE